jgi:cytochrome c biogenesis protein CcdA
VFEAPYALAVSAGILAAVNPCGFAMLPAYVSLLVTGQTAGGTEASRPLRLGRALTLTVAMTAGFTAFFGGFGLLAAPAADWLAVRLPWLTVVIGLILVLLGLWLVAGREIPSPVPKMSSAPVLRRRFWSMFGFGVAFAVASLGCTIGPFLAVVVAGFGSGSAVDGVGVFLAYAAGMALVAGSVSVAVAAAQQTLIRWLRRAAPVISRLAGALMAVAGAYVAWYGWYEIRLSAGAITGDVVVDTAAGVQSRLASAADRLGPAGFAVALLLIAGAVTVMTWWYRRRETPPAR